MKKSILFLAGAVLLFAGCAKVEDEAPIPETGKRVVTLKATIDEADTRVSVETDGTYHWQAGDEIGVWVVDSDGGAPYKYTTEDSGTTANFAVTLDAGEAIGEYAFYPFSEDSFVGGEGPRVALDANLDYVEGTTYMPMLGTISSDGTISFKSVGGVIKLTVNNIPSNAARLLFSAKDTNNENLVISGVFPVSGDQITSGGIMGLNSVNIDFTDKWKSSMEFYVPLPTGTYGGFELEFVNANSSETLVSKKVNFGQTGLTVSRNQIIVAPALDAAPPVVEKYYTKVTSNADLVSGQYLIVYEEGSVAFNGGLATLDAASNNIEVIMNNNRILSNTVTDAASFTITIDGSSSTIQSASGYYVGRTTDANGLNTSQTTAYTNTISIDQDGNATIVGSDNAHLRFNSAANDMRFRYYKSTTYDNQKPITLYRLDATAPISEKVLNSELSISGNIKKQFNVNEAFSFGDGFVKATYSNGETKTLQISDVTVTGFNSSVPADSQEITLSYTENEHTATGSYTVSIVGSIAGAKYKKVNTLTSGNKYLIAAGNGDGFIMPHPVSSAVQLGVSVSIINGEIESTESTDACAFTITRKQVNSQWYYVISYTDSGASHYVAASSATNTKLTNTTTVPSNVNQNSLWNITNPSTNYGTFNIQDAGQTERSILWRPLDGTTPFNKFGHYQGTGNATYYNVDLYEYTTATE